MLPFKYLSASHKLLPTYVADTVLSVTADMAVPENRVAEYGKYATDSTYALEDALYVNTMVTHVLGRYVSAAVVCDTTAVTPFEI